MALNIGRLGYLGLAIEDTAGDAETTPDIFVPFTDCSLEEKHEPLMDISSRASREMNYDAQTGKKWGEGAVTMYLDSTNIGYFLKLACGNEANTVITAGPPTVNDHLFYATVSGNAPRTATLWLYRGSGVSVNRFTYAAIDSLEVSIGTDGLATATANFISDSPTTVSAPTLTTTSGTLLTFKDMTMKFGDTTQAAEAATATKVTSFNFSINNNVQAIYRTSTTAGDSTPDVLSLGELEVSGDYTMFLEDDTFLDYYTGLTKKSLVAQLTGAGLGSTYTEFVKCVFKSIILQDKSIATGLSDYFAFTGNFKAIHSVDQAGFVDFTVRNGKSSLYA